jgi:syntaxin 7
MQGLREMATLSPNGSAGADKANQELRAIQFRAVTAFNRLRDDVARLGTTVDTPDLRRRIAGSTHRFGELAQQFRDAVAQHPSKDATSTQKIMRDFQGLLKNSERLLGTAREKEASSLPRSSNTASSLQDSSQNQADIERQSLLEQQKKQQLLQTEGELRFNEALINERDQAITEITGQIGEVHQIFQDLAVLVHDQGEMMDDIESNITRAATQTQDAHVQIIRAERSQRKARNTWCFLMMLAAGVVAVLLLIILA